MKRKTIKKVLDKKIADWLSSIKDHEVRVAASNEVIVTGGSIASMLLGETINDFDIYFKTMETTKAVAEYYVSEFLETHEDYKGMISVEVGDRVNIKGQTEERVSIIVASEGIAGDNPDDETDEPLEEKPEIPDDDRDPYQVVFLSENAITMTDKMQIIVRFFGDPEAIHSNFDFAHAMCWYEVKTRQLELPTLALECLLSRTLVYTGSLYPVCSIFRARKFITRGWKITAGDLLKIMWQISEINLKDMSVLREQLTGVDALYFLQLVAALEGVSEEKLNSAYVSEIIDRVFND